MVSLPFTMAPAELPEQMEFGRKLKCRSRNLAPCRNQPRKVQVWPVDGARSNATVFRTEIVQVKFEGIPAMRIETAGMRLIVPLEGALRIASFGRPWGRNLLFWDPE